MSEWAGGFLPAPATRSVQAFADAVDQRHEPSQSVVLRYRDALRLERDPHRDATLKATFERTSVREGLRILPLQTHRDVAIDLLDETSLMHTRTLKSIDGCVTTAQCLLRGDRRVVFESGANTGAALAAYGTRVGLETFMFMPAENLDLLDGHYPSDERVRLFAVEDPRRVKDEAADFAARHRLPRIPELRWRIQASAFVGCFLLERLWAGGRYDILAQPISAGFGPIGIYRMLRPFRRQLGGLPAFLGVQQSSNCAMALALGATAPSAAAPGPVSSTAGLLARVMYDSRPATYGTVEPLRQVLQESGGRVTTIDRRDFRRAVGGNGTGRGWLERLAARGVRIARNGGEIADRTGLMALAAVIREIDSGRIAPGSRVLVCLTAGSARAGHALERSSRSGAERHGEGMPPARGGVPARG